MDPHQLEPHPDATQSPILVTGGTGTLGRLVVAMLRDRDLDVRVLSRTVHADALGITFFRGDLVTDRGIGSAVEGVGTIVHCAGGPKHDDTAASTLVAHATKAGVRHIVYVSVVGADRVPIGYFRRKAAVENIIAESGSAWSGVRAAQFHDFVADLAHKASRLPVIPLPSAIRFQPVDPSIVANRLVGLVSDGPTNAVEEIVGSSTSRMSDLVRSVFEARHQHRLIVPIPLVGAARRAYREGANLSDRPGAGGPTWEDFLQTSVRTGPVSVTS